MQEAISVSCYVNVNLIGKSFKIQMRSKFSLKAVIGEIRPGSYLEWFWKMSRKTFETFF